MNKPDFKPHRLLVVEDNENDRELLLRQIKKANIEEHIIFVDSGLKAIELIMQDVSQTIFAVFLDLKLCGMDGLEVLRRMRSSPRTQAIPVIVMSGSENPADIAECHRLKVSSYLVKPINFSSFCNAVAGVFHLPSEATIMD